MKHPLPTTLILLALFLISQVIGLSLLAIKQEVTPLPDGGMQVSYGTTPLGDLSGLAPSQGFLFMVIGVAVGTGLMLFLIRFRAFSFIKTWFFVAVSFALLVALAVLLPTPVALVIAVVFAAWKVFRPNAIVHNLTELFIYPGITVMLAPLFDLFWAVLLLVAISIYDAYAVWHSGHMVTMAKAQSEQRMFAGLHLTRAPAKRIQPPNAPKRGKGSGAAILGGGDIAFPMIFAGAVLTWLVGSRGIAPVTALSISLIIPLCALIALAGLFLKSEKGKFYPAMPFLSAGCLLGLGIVALLA